MATSSFIDDFLREIPNYITCLPSDLITNVVNYPWVKSETAFFVVNLSPSYILDDGHWILVIMYDNGDCELFDSLALAKEYLPPDILKFLSIFKKVSFNRIQIQADHSNFCGVFVIARALSLIKSVTLPQFMENFHKEMLDKNDHIVTEYVMNNVKFLY